jgi:hypothetical protein
MLTRSRTETYRRRGRGGINEEELYKEEEELGG